MDFQNVDPDQVALCVLLTGDLLGGSEHSVGGLAALADAEEHITAGGVDAQHGAGEQLLSLGGVGFVHNAPLGFPDALNDHLLGGLGGDPAEFRDINRNGDGVAQLHGGVNPPGRVNMNFQRQIRQLVHDGLDLVHAQAFLAEVHHHILGGNIPVILPILAVGVGQRLFQTLHHVIHGNALELFQFPQRSENFSADIHLGGFGLLLGCLSCHKRASLEFHTKPHLGDLGFFKLNCFFTRLYGELPLVIGFQHAGNLLQPISGAVQLHGNGAA